MYRPRYDGEPCSLGLEVLNWITSNLASPDGLGGPLVLTPEQAEFVVKFYVVDESTATQRLIRRAVYSRAKGSGKSPLLAAIAAAEALGPVVPDGFDAHGRPVGKPWVEIRTPWVQLSGASEDQTRNAWTPLLEMLREGNAVSNYPGLEPMETFVNLPVRGRIEFVTSSARSREGNRPVYCALDQSETWTPSNGGVRLAATMRRNLGKTGGSSIESPNAYLPGEESVAEESAAYRDLIVSGKARDDGFYYDHREAPEDTELDDRDSLLAGLAWAYGCSARSKCVLPGHDHGPGWVDLERIAAEVYDPATDPQDAQRYYLNMVTHASDAYLSAPEWAGCRSVKTVESGDLITLGFDGSRGKARGKPDATALIGCRVNDGHVFEIGVWEADDGPGMDEWTPPLPEIDAAIEEVFATYNVAAFYADPAKDWRSKVGEWEARYAGRLAQTSRGTRLFVTRDHPFEWWMTGGRSYFIMRAVESFAGAVRNQDMTHDGSFALTAHVLNARRRIRRQALTIGKSHAYSSKKVDAAVAAVLAWQARLDSVAGGVEKPRPVHRGRIVRLR